MSIDLSEKRSREELKSYFVRNAIPTEAQFADLIAGGFNQVDDRVAKAPGQPLSLEAVGGDTSDKQALSFYTSFADQRPAFSVRLRGRADDATPMLTIRSNADDDQLCLDAETGRVGVGTIAPLGKLHVEGSLVAGGSDVYFTDTAHNYSTFGNTDGYAAIQNARNYDALMILGRSTRTNNQLTRRVRLWDRLDVEGELTAEKLAVNRSDAGDHQLWVNGQARVEDLLIGNWPASGSGNYLFLGTSRLTQSNSENYGLLIGNRAGRGNTYLNAQTRVFIRTKNTSRIEIRDNQIRCYEWFVVNPSNNRSHRIYIGRPHRDFVGGNGRYGGDGIRGDPNLWLDARSEILLKSPTRTNYFDIAEHFSTTVETTPGDVVVYDPAEQASRLCDAYADTKVLGIVSGAAGLILGFDDSNLPVALCGRVPCKVDADVAPIAVGDLLTTSARSGHAQKALDPGACQGAIIGKALEALAEGQGEILVFVMPR